MPERTALYRLYDADDVLLYVGITATPKQRWSMHADTKTWWPQVARKEVEWFDTRTTAAKAEVTAILSEAPLHNQSSALDRLGLYKEIANALRESIQNGELPVGSQLPSENALAKRFSTTRVTVRKGIALLRAEGLITSQQGKRAFVQAADRTVSVPIGHPERAAEILRAALTSDQLADLTRSIVLALATEAAAWKSTAEVYADPELPAQLTRRNGSAHGMAESPHAAPSGGGMIRATAQQLRAQRTRLLAEVHMTYEELRDRAADYNLSAAELDAWHTIEGIDYLLAADNV